jgi:hypothetical protein
MRVATIYWIVILISAHGLTSLPAEDCGFETCGERRTKCHEDDVLDELGSDLGCDGHYCPEYITVKRTFDCIGSTVDAEHCCWNVLCLEPQYDGEQCGCYTCTESP